MFHIKASNIEKLVIEDPLLVKDTSRPGEWLTKPYQRSVAGLPKRIVCRFHPRSPVKTDGNPSHFFQQWSQILYQVGWIWRKRCSSLLRHRYLPGWNGSTQKFWSSSLLRVKDLRGVFKHKTNWSGETCAWRLVFCTSILPSSFPSRCPFSFARSPSVGEHKTAFLMSYKYA